MIFRQAGIRHTDYAATRQLWPLPADRVARLASALRRLQDVADVADLAALAAG